MSMNKANASLLEQLRAAPPQRQLEIVNSLPIEHVIEMARQPWWLVARPQQLEPPTNWSIWLMLAGRGFGKTRSCSEWLVDSILRQPKAPDGSPTEWAIIADTFGETRTICVEGPSGLLGSLSRRGFTNNVEYAYNRSSWQINFKDGQRVHMFGADSRDTARGYNLAGVWADEIAKWRYPRDTWAEGIAPALRIGTNPRAVIATTPKPNPLLAEWVRRTDGSVYVTRGSTFDNAANLSPAALSELRARYDGTRIGRQELYGELLEDVVGALWTRKMIEDARVRTVPAQFERIIVAIDPAATAGEDSSETGIIVAGVDEAGTGYVLDDVSGRYSPDTWARRAVEAYHRHKADRIVGEVNQGGDMVETIIRMIDSNIPYRSVRATRGKATRAEPIAALYEQGRIKHAPGLDLLEDQLATWVPGGTSPDRLDALVWAFSDLMLGNSDWTML